MYPPTLHALSLYWREIAVGVVIALVALALVALFWTGDRK